MVDVEGNGQQPPDLVEISIVAIESGTIGRPRNWLIRPPRPITAMARRFHKITDDQVAGAPRGPGSAGAKINGYALWRL
ncbi:hypothetical protein [Streptosporangium lutulentum]|uniref:DNA polymerase III epsilon subunit-like protein n=1 Tax=Streptosporangium lutulentum TaxID=1461250 RepID=A0ABT9Q8T3_9ACTN|nr:hypothetical protein [Streptosporangium lutulentum]MDP9843148.1 DNA polymerase III epsilon subunit-like protein [Streptosporangium lutulentum]